MRARFIAQRGFRIACASVALAQTSESALRAARISEPDPARCFAILQARVEEAAKPPPAPVRWFPYTVRPGDSLRSIAKTFCQRKQFFMTE